MNIGKFLRGIKALFFVSIAFGGALNLQAQQNNTPSHLDFKLNQSGLEIISELEQCAYPKETNTTFEYLLLKVKNTLDIPVRIEFDKIPYYDGECVNCQEFPREEMKVLLELSPQEVIQGTCANNVRNRMRVFVSMSQHTKERLTNFRIENLVVTPLEK